MQCLAASLCAQRTYFIVSFQSLFYSPVALFFLLHMLFWNGGWWTAFKSSQNTSEMFGPHLLSVCLVLWCHFLSDKIVLAMQEAVLVRVRHAQSWPMKVQGEEAEGPVEQLCNLSVICNHTTPYPLRQGDTEGGGWAVGEDNGGSSIKWREMNESPDCVALQSTATVSHTSGLKAQQAVHHLMIQYVPECGSLAWQTHCSMNSLYKVQKQSWAPMHACSV